MKRDKHLRSTPDQSHSDIPALRFWDTIDRDQFELALSDHDKNDKYAAFLQAPSDPTYARCSFPTLLRKFNISLHEAQTIYTNHMRTWPYSRCAASSLKWSRTLPRTPRAIWALVPAVTAKRLLCPP